LLDGEKNAQKLKQSIRFEKVSFSHSQDVPILQAIDLEIKKGEKVAIVGPSGGGKSTLCDLLLRLHDPEIGSILYDNEDIRHFKRSSYIQRFGVVPQENLLLSSSVRENVLYGRPYDRKRFEHAITTANAAEFIGNLPNMEETLIGDRGVRLSGGQRQRLAIARAVYGEPEVLILDEATSALDSVSERLVQEAIEKATQGMTTIVVAHRLSTVRHADKIVVIENGRVEACGTHDELLEISEKYRELCQFQFGLVEQ
jgi:ABC-type multidrug transport system fused ATPase/permease subunit